jgi:CRP/FNR family transcriptional regulator, cyclic AMP receptor protein
MNQIVAGRASSTVETSHSQLVVGPGLITELESIGQSVSFRTGDHIITEGEPGKGIYILRSGSARVSMHSHDGNTIQLRELKPGSFIGLSGTLSCDHCCYSVEATGPAELTFVSAGAVQEFLRSRPDLCLQVIQMLGQEMSSLCHERTILNAGMKPIRIEA